MDDLLPSLLLAYLIGSLPFSYWAARWRGVDVREVGSRNVGATNVARTAGATAGLCALLLDAAKGLLVAVIARFWVSADHAVSWSVVAAVLGHVYPVWLRFRGGKGVATGVGGLLFLLPKPTLLALAPFFLVLAVTRVVSLASMSLVLSAVVLGVVFGAERAQILPALGVALIVTWRHRSNIARLRRGTEVRVDFFQKAREVLR